MRVGARYQVRVWAEGLDEAEYTTTEIPAVKDGLLTIVDAEDDNKTTVYQWSKVVCFDYVPVDE